MHGTARASRPGALRTFPAALVRLAGGALLVGAAACAPEAPRWTKAGATIQQLSTDRDQCLAMSQEYLATGDSRTNYTTLEQCMARKGYSTAR
jgi:hypothetical protein